MTRSAAAANAQNAMSVRHFSRGRAVGPQRRRLDQEDGVERRRRDDRGGGRPEQVTLVADGGRRGVLREAVEGVDVAADGQDPHQRGRQRAGRAQRSGGQPRGGGPLYEPARRDDQRDHRLRAVQQRGDDGGDVLAAERAVRDEQIAQPPVHVEGHRQRRERDRYRAEHPRGRIPAPKPVVLDGDTGDRRLRREQRAPDAEQQAGPDPRRHQAGSAAAPCLQQLIDDEADGDDQVGERRAAAGSGLSGGHPGRRR